MAGLSSATTLLGREVPTDPIGIRFSLAEVLAALTYPAKQGKARRAEDGRWERA
jgi:hypothetical protein